MWLKRRQHGVAVLPGQATQASEIGDLSRFVRSARRVTQRHITRSPLTF